MVGRALIVVVVLAVAGAAVAEPRAKPRDLTIAILLDPGGHGDRGINDATLAGLDASRKQGPIAAMIQPAPTREHAESALDMLASQTPDLIVGVGPGYVEPFRVAAARYPRVRFLLLDAELPDVPRVRSVTFRADEGSFLAGVVAAVESKRGRVGFVGGMQTPAIQAVECGWETGVRWATKERFLAVRGRAVYIGTTADAFVDPTAAEELSREMIADHGSDVMYAAAGASGVGVIAAARHAKVKMIGVESDQSHLGRDVVITSVRKRLDRAVETAIADVRRELFDGGVRVMSLANGGVDLVLPGRLPPATVKLVEKARAAVISGATPACVKEEDRVPAWPFPPRPAG